MLTSLHIQNYALIDALNISFERGFSVITGETGAGKSIILGAIGLLLGQRADSKAIKSGASRCVIEAHFNLSGYGLERFFEENDLDFDGSECIVRREINSNGKSRAFINDTPAPVTLLKEMGESLIDVHSQHQNLLLNKEDFQLNTIDILANDRAELQVYQTAYGHYRQACRALQEAIEETERNKTDEDYLRFQWEQLESAHLQAGEQERLEQEQEALNHAEEIKQTLYQADAVLSGEEQGVTGGVKDVTARLHNIIRVYPKIAELAQRMESCYIELKDIAEEIASAAEDVEFNPERLAEIDERLNVIYSLQQKFHADTVEQLITLKEEYETRLAGIQQGEDRLTQLEQEKQEAYAAVTQQGAVLTQMRNTAARRTEKLMQEKLIPLGIPNVRFCVELTARDEPDATGMDRICFLFSANKNGTLLPIAQVASGGEIARVMLSLKALISGAVKLPTIIFDEIDTGVSGNIAEKMALIMEDMGAAHRQVISITHLPQIAARGKAHYKVFKKDDEKGTTSHIVRLTEEQRVEEIAHMLSGSTLTEAALDNARELLHPVP